MSTFLTVSGSLVNELTRELNKNNHSIELIIRRAKA